MIEGYCFTNLDDFATVTWPERFVAVPRIGEHVEGRRGANMPSLRVVAVTHRMIDGRPTICVELHQ